MSASTGRSSKTALAERSQECLAVFARDPFLALRAGQFLPSGIGEPLTPRTIVQVAASLTVATALSRYERPGWTVIATDVWGLYLVNAQRILKARHAGQIIGRRTRKMPSSFGHGTEVVKGITIDLVDVLPGALDVTSQFTN